MVNRLGRICNELGVWGIRTNDYGVYRRERPTPSYEYLLEVMRSLSEDLESSVTIIGGQSTHPKLLGYKHMRRPSLDIDCVLRDEEGVRKLVSQQNGHSVPRYSFNYDDLFLDYRGLPVSFAMGHIHDWCIPEDFFDSLRHFDIGGYPIFVAAPEYTIMLKCRRAIEKRRFFGKDVVDIGNIMVAPRVRDIAEVDYEKAADLIRRSVSEKEGQLQWLVDSIQNQQNLSREERDYFEEDFPRFRDALL